MMSLTKKTIYILNGIQSFEDWLCLRSKHNLKICVGCKDLEKSLRERGFKRNGRLSKRD